MRLLAMCSIILMNSPPVFAAANQSQSGEVVFASAITPELVDAFINKYDDSDISRIIVFSPGGDVGAGIRFGYWVHKKNLDVQVRTMCASACANYVFAAGNNKIIEPGALVVWHGSMEQKSLRDEIASYLEIKKKFLSQPELLTKSEREFYDLKSNHYELTMKLRATQKDFYSDIGVNEFITRLAQEPVKYEVDAGTATLGAMEHYGIKKVTVPDGYATRIYLNNHMLSRILFGKINIFDLVNERIERITEDD